MRVFQLLLVFVLAGLSFSCDNLDGVPDAEGLYAVIDTNQGRLVIELYPDSAPQTVEKFVKLANNKFYDGIVFHRVIPQFMAQTGDPHGNGMGGPGYTFADEINADALGLDKLSIKDAPQYNRVVQQMVYRKLNIRNGRELQERIEEAGAETRKYDNMTVKEVLLAAGYQFDDSLPSKHPVRGSVAMANSGPNTNGSQFFINQVDTPHLTGLHTVFGHLVESFEVLDKIIAAGNGQSKMLSVRIVDRRK